MTTNYDLDTEEGMANSVAWTEKTFDAIRPNGTWVVPRSGMMVRIDHPNKAVHITEGWMPDEDVERVIRAMGWAVEHQ